MLSTERDGTKLWSHLHDGLTKCVLSFQLEITPNIFDIAAKLGCVQRTAVKRISRLLLAAVQCILGQLFPTAFSNSAIAE